MYVSINKDKSVEVELKRYFIATVSNMKNLEEVCESEQLAFLQSFDHVLSDLDGVIWLRFKPIVGASACINSLKANGKTVHYVTNNSTMPLELLKDTLQAGGLNVETSDIVTPITAIASYLRKIKFNKKVYVLGINTMRTELEKQGFAVVKGPQEIEETVHSLVMELQDDEEIGAVVVEFDLNLSYVKLQKAAIYLHREDCLFISGAADAKLPIGLPMPLIGPHYYQKPLVDFSGREPYQIAKPSIHFNEYLVEKFKITNKSRVLFIGDSINEDLNFATKCGYQKLLVLSGITKKQQLLNWTFPEEYKPQYYVENLNVLNDIIQKCIPTSVSKI